MQPIKEYAFDNFVVGESNKFASVFLRGTKKHVGHNMQPLCEIITGRL